MKWAHSVNEGGYMWGGVGGIQGIARRGGYVVDITRVVVNVVENRKYPFGVGPARPVPV